MAKSRRFGDASFASAVGAVLLIGAGYAAPAHAQISIGVDAGLTDNAVCVGGGDSQTLGVADGQDCNDGFTESPFLQVGPDSSYALFDAANGASTFTGTASFQDNVQFSGGTQSFSGTTSFGSTVAFNGPSVTFSTGTNFQNPATFNGTTNFTAGMTTTNITNSGTINSTNMNVTGSLTAAPGTTINLGGVNRIQGVAAGINDLDAVNVAQLNTATAGITTDITALETTTATHTTQIADLETTTVTHTTQIASLETTTANHTTQIGAIEAVNTTQSNQITAIQAVNTAQSSQISALQAAQDLVQGQVDALFDLRSRDRRDMKQGVASAMAMAAAPMPSEPGRIAYAVNGATFRGEYAVGGSLTYRLNTGTPMAVNAGFSYAGNKNNGVRVGIAGEF